MTRLLCAALLGTCAMAGTAAADPASGTARPLTPGEMDRVTAGVLPDPAATWMLAGVIGAVPGALPGDGTTAGGTTVVASGTTSSTATTETSGGTTTVTATATWTVTAPSGGAGGQATVAVDGAGGP